MDMSSGLRRRPLFFYLFFSLAVPPVCGLVLHRSIFPHPANVLGQMFCRTAVSRGGLVLTWFGHPTYVFFFVIPLAVLTGRSFGGIK